MKEKEKLACDIMEPTIGFEIIVLFGNSLTLKRML